MKTIVSFIALAVLLMACSESKEEKKATLKDKITEQEKRVSELSEDYKNAEETDSAKLELASVLSEYYHEYPKDEYAATCLSKLHMLYANSDVKTSTAYADTLLDQYPDFVDRAQMIESQIINYELEIRPRNKEMVKKYLKLWLKENKDAPKEKIEGMKYHLEHVDQPLAERLTLNKHELD